MFTRNALFQGVSGIGKTRWIFEALKNREKMFNSVYEVIIYAIPPHSTSLQIQTIREFQSICHNLIVYEGLLYDLQSIYTLRNPEQYILLILDGNSFFKPLNF